MVTLSFTIFSGQKNYNRAHMLFQVLCGFEPIFYTTHPNEEPINFKLFIIMDTDDCDEITRSKYISKELFDGHPLKDYIVPLYNDTNLEDVMIKSGIMVKRIPDAQKGSYYTKIFPINTKPLSIDTVNQVRIFAKKIDGVKETNMLAFVEYCFQQMPGEELWG